MQPHYRLIPNRPLKKAQPHTYSVSSKVVVYAGASASWYLLFLPKTTSKEIKARFGGSARGWGSLRVRVKLGKSEWETSIFPSKEKQAYLLLLKKEIRVREGVGKGDTVRLQLTIG